MKVAETHLSQINQEANHEENFEGLRSVDGRATYGTGINGGRFGRRLQAGENLLPMRLPKHYRHGGSDLGESLALQS